MDANVVPAGCKQSAHVPARAGEHFWRAALHLHHSTAIVPSSGVLPHALSACCPFDRSGWHVVSAAVAASFRLSPREYDSSRRAPTCWIAWRQCGRAEPLPGVRHGGHIFSRPWTPGVVAIVDPCIRGAWPSRPLPRPSCRLKWRARVCEGL